DTHVVVLGGAPLDAPRYVWWNYVASSEELIERAQRAWQADELGGVDGDPERIPLPEARPAVRLLAQ
ncbi:MAG: pirin-like C-terminal cupin domain-containing protein, partial [Gammaproteobacteria bacterium]